MVVNTGANTYFGKTVKPVNIARPKSKKEELMMADEEQLNLILTPAVN